jgi:LysM repeat protein
MPSPTPPTQTSAPDTLTRQLRLFKTLAAVFAAALVIGGGTFLYLRHLGQPVTILVNNKPVATVRNAAAANSLLAAAEQSKVGTAYAQEEPVRMQKVRFVRADPNAAQDPDLVAQAHLAQHLTLHIPAFVILVKGHPSVALPTADDATQTLRLVKDHWAQMPPQAEISGQPEILESTDIQKRTVDTRLTRQTPEQAAPYFWTPPPSKSYTVKPGDLGSRIAYRNHISLAELITANPSKDINHLKPGDLLNVQKMPLLLTVRVLKKLQATEKVYAGVPAAQAGLQSVTYVVTYLNGQETHREAQSVEILEKPEVRMSL